MNMKKNFIFYFLLVMVVFQSLQARPNIKNDPSDENDWCNIQRMSLQEELSKAKTDLEKNKIRERYKKNKVMGRFCGGV